MLRRWTVFALALLSMLCVLRPAKADPSSAHGVTVAVIALDSDDAEEQAEALTLALRTRIRTSQGWSLQETSQSLSMLTAALRCPGKPPGAECEQKIADQLKAERYIFGYVTRGPAAGTVTAEVHFYQRKGQDMVVKESYSDQLKDVNANEDALKKVAQHILEKLGTTTLGSIAVHVGNENGEIIVDGGKPSPLQGGNAKLELAPGSHSVEINIPGQAPQKRNVVVTVGKETVIDLSLTTPGPVEKPKEESAFPTNKVIGGGLLALGAAAAVVSVINVVSYGDDQDKGKQFEKDLPPGQDPDAACEAKTASGPVCDANDDAHRHSTIAIATGIGAGVALVAGSYFFFFAGDNKDKDKPSTATKPRLVPNVGYNSGGLTLLGRF
jgi:hypothetical protein